MFASDWGGLTAVLGLVGDDGVLRLFAFGGGPGDFIFEGEILALQNRGYLSGLHAVMFGHGECKRLEKTFLFDT